MATINHKIKVTEEGLTEIEQKGRRVNKQLTDGEKNARAMGRALKSTESPTLSAGRGEDRQDYRVARAGAGTGAAGRDFAKQAQGLGGLVHVYATFAANIFAVTAAFTALDRAYSTIRLEQAADIMSTKVGFSVKNLSKDLQEATGHSISFQEAMNFSAMGISAGMTGKQITNLTIIAKGAANALGRDMGDAVRRIVQGTAKQEQEILDELGIFVRAKTAYAEYAKKIGTDDANALTAQQRVQAYAEAVEQAGEKWKDFAQIEDPFSRFTATLKEAGVEILNVLNSVISPVLALLSTSKSTLEGIIVAITAALLSRALPGMKEGLTGLFTVDAAGIAREAALSKKLLLDKNNETIQGIEKQQKESASRLKGYKEAMGDETSSYNTKVSQHNKILKQYDAEAAKLKLMIALQKVDTGLSSKYGVNTNILRANVSNPAANIDVNNQDSLNKAIQSTLKQQILVKSELTSQANLQTAIDNKLLKQGSTLSNLMVTEEARSAIIDGIIKKKDLLHKADAVAVAWHHKLVQADLAVQKAQVSLDETKATAQQLRKEEKGIELQLENELNIAKARGVELEKGAEAYRTSKQAKAIASKTAFGAMAAGINTGLYEAPSIGAKADVLKGIPSQFGAVFTASEGKIEKTKTLLRGAGLAGSLAVRGILSAVMPLMLAFTAWDLAIRPILKAFGFFPEYTAKIAEATQRLAESTTAAKEAITKFNDSFTSSTTGEQAIQFYQNKSQALLGIKNEIDKLIVELEKKPLGAKSWWGFGKSDKDSEDASKGGTYAAPTRLTEQQQSLNAALSNESDLVIKASIGLSRLYEIKVKLATLESERKYHTISEATYQKKLIELAKDQSAATETLNNEYQKSAALISGIIDPMKQAEKSYEDYLGKIKGTSKAALVELGLLDTELQGIVTNQETSLNKLINSTASPEDKTTAANSMIDAINSSMETLGASTPETTAAIFVLLQTVAIGGKAASMEAEQLLTIFKSLGLQAQDAAKALKKQNLEAELRLAKSQEALKYSQLLTKEEEKHYGFISASTLKEEKRQELNIASLTLAKSRKSSNDLEKAMADAIYNTRKKEIEIAYKERGVQQDINELKYNSIEPAQRALNLAKAEYDYKRKTIGTNALDALKVEEAFRQESFNLKIQQLGELNTEDKQNAADNIKNESEVSKRASQAAEFELHKKELQETTTLGLELYLARQEELIKGEAKLAAYDKLGLTFAELKKAQVTEELAKINSIHSVELKLLNLAKLKASVEKDIADQKKRQHEADKRALSDALGTKDYEEVLTKVGGWSTIVFNEAHKRTSDFKDSMRTVIEGAFDGLYAGMDSAIDNLSTKWMKSQKFSLKEIVLDFRNAAAEEFRKMAADQMKLASRKAVEGISLAVFGAPKEKEKPKDQVHYLELIEKHTAELVKQKAADPKAITESIKKTETDFFDNINKTTTEDKIPVEVKKSEEAVQKIDSQASGVFTTIFDGVKTHIDNIFGAKGFLAAGFDILKNVLTDLFSSKSTSSVGGTSSGSVGGSFISAGISTIASYFGFANGGIMSQYGAMKLNTYASGGIATSPQLTLFGEGRQNEAYVPLPDGRTIPVTMKAPASSGNTGPISITVQVNTTTGKTDTKVDSGAAPNSSALMAEFGNIIAKKVKEEIIYQSRPNGLLNR